MAWTNAPKIVYHGTDETAADAIMRTSISLTRCNPKSDFGPGFYVTSNLHEARFWADWRAHTTNGRAAVMAFDLDRDGIANAGEHIAFILPDDDFHDFVHYNRHGNLNHGRSGNSTVHPPVPPRPYDLVYGPVSNYPERVHIPEWDQICFFHQNSLNWLQNKRIFEKPTLGYFIFP